MSKEIVRQKVSARFMAFTGLDADRKGFPNQPKREKPTDGSYATLEILFMLNKVTSISDRPCTRRTGVISIEVAEQLDAGTKGVTTLTDELEEWFGLWDSGNLWTGAANTYYPGEDKSKMRYITLVQIPFTYDQP